MMTSKKMDKIIKLVKENNPRNNVEIVSNLLAVKQDLERLEQLEKKEIPMKPIDNYKDGLDDEVFKNDSYICPKCCNWLNIGKNYCDNCGQRLDWSECNE